MPAHGAPLPLRLPVHRLQRSSGSVCELRLVFGESRAPFELAVRQKKELSEEIMAVYMEYAVKSCQTGPLT